ncbi:MAG: 16S rRNA (uracil(1498)-N(3))-methyltransferase [Coprobacillus sp.]|nr:16S rRNA (uracil(1498)-N(3))-methyltransferase [Coprobacillus sp.]
MRQRYFPLNIENNKIFVSPSDEHHILHVMRKRIGDELFFSYKSKSYVGRIDSVRPLEISLMYEEKEVNELQVDITLYLCSLKKDKNEFIIQKASELGVSKIVFVDSARVVNHFTREDLERLGDRFNKIIKEACEQCQRSSLLEIGEPISLKDIKGEEEVKLVPYEMEKGDTSSLIKELETIKEKKSVGVIIGPEGGFTPEEIAFLKEKGYKSVSLGKRILRSETATLYILSAISLFLESK